MESTITYTDLYVITDKFIMITLISFVLNIPSVSVL